MGYVEDTAFETEIKKWPTQELIYILSQNSIHYINHADDQFMKNYYIEENVVQHNDLRHKKVLRTFLAPWDLITIEYYSIKFSTDHNTGKRTTISNIISRFQKSSYLESIATSISDDPDNVFFYLFGLSAEQFNIQTPAMYLRSFNRNYHILVGSQKIRRQLTIEIGDILEQTVGITLEGYMQALILIFACCSKSPIPDVGFQHYFNGKDYNPDLRNNFEKVLDFYTADYPTIRNSKFGRKQLEITPFIKTKKENLILMSSYLNIFQMFGNSLYWLIRNYFFRNEKIRQQFTNAFGLMFEDYIVEYAEYHHFPLVKIPETDYKSVDYKFENDEYLVLIEVKSLLLNIFGRSQNPNIEDLVTFYERGIAKASEQIESTLQNMTIPKNKTVISLILLFDSLYAADILSNVDLPRFEKNNMFTVGIDSFEDWIGLFSEDSSAFNHMLKKLHYCDDPKDNRGFAKTLENFKEYFHSTPIPEWDYFNIFINGLASQYSP